MPEQLDPDVAENLASGAMRYLPLTPGKKVLCTKRQLQNALSRSHRRPTPWASSRARRSSSAH